LLFESDLRPMARPDDGIGGSGAEATPAWGEFSTCREARSVCLPEVA
jgi:hypothetical protein